MDKTYQWLIWENVRKVWLLPYLSGSFSLSLPHSIVKSTPLFHHMQTAAFSLHSHWLQIRQRKITRCPIIEADEAMKTRKERQTASYAVVNGMFLSLPEKGEVGAEKKEKEREERDSFFTKAICKSLALGGEQLLWIREQHRVAELKLSGPWLD